MCLWILGALCVCVCVYDVCSIWAVCVLCVVCVCACVLWVCMRGSARYGRDACRSILSSYNKQIPYEFAERSVKV